MKRYSFKFFLAGRSMIEMLGVLAIIGVLSIGGLYAYRQAMEQYDYSRAMDFISKVKQTYLDYCYGVENSPYLGNANKDILKEFLCSEWGGDFCQEEFLNSGRIWSVLFERIEGVPNLVSINTKLSGANCLRAVGQVWDDGSFKLIKVYINDWRSSPTTSFLASAEGHIVDQEGARTACKLQAYAPYHQVVFLFAIK